MEETFSPVRARNVVPLTGKKGSRIARGSNDGEIFEIIPVVANAVFWPSTLWAGAGSGADMKKLPATGSPSPVAVTKAVELNLRNMGRLE